MEEEIRDIIKNNSWRETYKQICIASALPKDISATSVACEEENRIRNRYGDVHPYDHSRVCLPDASNDYINASLVVNELASRRYILAQGPLPNTIGHFWSMVWHENSGAILMLNKLMEKGVNKCEQYWPPNPGETLLCEDVHIKVENLQSESRNDYILTTLRITDLNSNKERGVLHFQYIAWPDFGVPRCPDTFLNFLDAVRQTGSLDADAGPPIVHCSAGIGRSGTFCLVDTSLVLIAKEGPGSVVLKDVLLDLRSYRMGLIQTWEQLKFSYLAIVSGAKRDGQLSESFLDDYDIFLAAAPPPLPSLPKVEDDEDSSPPPLPPPRTDSLLHKGNGDDDAAAAKAPSSSSSQRRTTPLTNGGLAAPKTKITSSSYGIPSHDDDGDMGDAGLHSEEAPGTTTKTEESTTILNSHKMEERKKEVLELRRQLREEKKQQTMSLLEDMKRKQRESEKQKIRRKYIYENMCSFCVGVSMVLAGVAFYYYDGGSN